MQMASSAKRTCSELRSASLYTATLRMPNSLHAQITRRAISPRLAIRIFLNIGSLSHQAIESSPASAAMARSLNGPMTRSGGSYPKQRLAVLHGLSVFGKLLHDFAGGISFDFVHQLHCFDDAQHLANLHVVTRFNEGWRARRRTFIEGANDR